MQEQYVRYSRLYREKCKFRAVLAVLTLVTAVCLYGVWKFAGQNVKLKDMADAYEQILGESKTLNSINANLSGGNERLTESNALLKTQIQRITQEKADSDNKVRDNANELELMQKAVQALNMDGNNISVDVNNWRKLSDAAVSQLDAMLEGTPLAGCGFDFLEAEQRYGVNAVMLMGVLREESGLGKSELAQRNNNLSGMKAGGGDEYRSFASMKECLFATAELIGTQYLDEQGKFHSGFSTRDINIMYAINDDGTVNWDWHENVNNNAYSLLRGSNDG